MYTNNKTEDYLNELTNFINNEDNTILERRLGQFCENIILWMIDPNYVDLHPIEQIRIAAKIIKKGY